MRAVVQRVLSGSVSVHGKEVSRIGRGMVVLVGCDKRDSPAEARSLAKKLAKLRLWEDENDKGWTRGVTSFRGQILFISQFTLCATLKASKPSFHLAMPPAEAKSLYETFLDNMHEEYAAAAEMDAAELRSLVGYDQIIQDGRFGEMMNVQLVNDGPVTIVIE